MQRYLAWTVLSLVASLVVAAGGTYPSFTAGTSLTPLQDSGPQTTKWASNISDNSGGIYTLKFVLSCTSASVFFSSTGQPTLSTDGTLSFTPATSMTGSSLCTVYLSNTDVGCGLFSTCDSASSTFTITIVPVNSCPTWNLGSNTQITYVENSGTQQVQFATSLATGAVTSAGALKASWESTQKLSIVMSTTSTSLFVQQPTAVISSTTAYVRFQSADGASGTAVVYATLYDDGGSSYGGCDHSATTSFTIVITFVNQAPSFAFAYPSPVVVNENSGSFVLNGFVNMISPGTNEDSQTVQFAVSYASSSDKQYFSVDPTVTSTGTLSFTPLTNWCTSSNVKFFISITDSLGLANCDLSGSVAGSASTSTTCQSFTVQIVCINLNPYFTPGSDITVWEQSADGVTQTSSGWAQGISAGSTQENPNQKVSFILTQSNNALYSVFPTIPSGTNVATRSLSFAPAAYQNGQSLVSVQITDDQSTNYLGNSAQLNIIVLPVNDPPQFTFVQSSYQVNENVGAVSIDGFINAIAPGPSAATDEVTQKVTVTVTGTPASSFVVPPALFFTATNAARVDFTLADNIYGYVTLTVTAVDDGGTARGGSDTTSKSFIVTILQVNNPPTFTVNPTSITNFENQYTGPGAVVTNFVTSVTTGLYEPQALTPSPSGVAASPMTVQNTTLSITSTKPELFAIRPNISQTGTLMYTLLPNTYGQSVLTVTVTDNGSPPLSTSTNVPLTVLFVNQPPSFSIGTGLSNKTLTECRTQPNCPYTYSNWASPLSSGPTGEPTQTLQFTISTGAAAFLFAVAPSIDATSGTLSFALTPNQNTYSTGPLQIIITCQDSGGTANGGVDTTVKAANISVAPYAGTPSVGAVTTSLQMLRNQAPKTFSNFMSSISAGYVGMDATSLQYSVTITSGASLFNTVPLVVASSSAAASITVNISAHIDGTAALTVTLLNAAQGKSTSIDFTIIVLPVNEQPTFALIANLFTVNQGVTSAVVPIATNISAGINEASQVVAFTLVCPSTPVLFVGTPTVDTSGQLRLSTIANAEGTISCSVYLTDNGGTANGGVDTSATSAFAIQVLWVNHAPSFTFGASSVATYENAGPFSLAWASSISPGLYDASKSQVLTFTVWCGNTSGLFATAPSIDSNGYLKFTPATNAFGSSACVVTLCDNGPGAPSPNANCSQSVSLTINVQFVNQPPVFTLANTTLTVVARGAAYSYTGFASGIAPGPTNENGQTLQVSTSVSLGSNLFSVQPAMSLAGSLTFTTANGASGIASVSICFSDNGGTQNGGVDTTCAVLTLSIVKLAVAPTYSVSNTTVTQLQRAGLVRIDSFISAITIQSGTLYGIATVTQSTADQCSGAFTTPPSVDFTTGYLQFAAMNSFFGSCTITVNVTDAQNGKWTATVVLIKILQVNIAPSFTPGALNITTAYSTATTSFPWASQLSVGDAAEVGLQNITGYAKVLTSGVLALDAATFDSSTGYLSFKIASNVPATVQLLVYLRDTGGTANGGVDTSSTVTVTINIQPINTAPSFMLLQQYVVNQSSTGTSVTNFAYLISMGAYAWESSQLGIFTVVNNNSNAFSVLPQLTSAGTLTFSFVSTFVGVVNLTVTLQDNGGVANGGVDSFTRSTLLYVIGVNAAPAFTIAQSTVYAIQGVPLVLQPWALTKTAGNALEDAYQTVTYSVGVSPSLGQAQSSLFAQLTITPDNLTITTQRFATGSLPIVVTAVDNGGTANGGVNTYSSTFTVVVLVRNAPPVFTVPSTITVTATPNKVSLDQIVTALSAVESGQTVAISVVASPAGMFTVAPAIDSAGTLTFTLPDDNSTRAIQLTFIAVDNGGTTNGGNDTTTKAVTLQVNRPRTPPTFTLSTTSLTVSTASQVTVSGFATNLVSNGDTSVVTFNVTTDATYFTTVPTVDSTGTLSAVVGTTSGTTTLYVTGYNNVGVASTTKTVTVITVLPTTIQVIMNTDASSFNIATFRQQIATIFGVSTSNVIIVSWSAGSVIVNFYISGVQSTLSASTFVTRANTGNDPIRTALSVTAASVTSSGTPASTPQPATPSPASSTTSSDPLGISTTFWIVGAIILVVIIVAVVGCCCFAWHRKKAVGSDDAAVKPDETKPHPKDESVWIDVDADDDKYLPKRLPPQQAVFNNKAYAMTRQATPKASHRDHHRHERTSKYHVAPAHQDEFDADVFVDVMEVEQPPPAPPPQQQRASPKRSSRRTAADVEPNDFGNRTAAQRGTPARNGPSWINRYSATPSAQF